MKASGLRPMDQYRKVWSELKKKGDTEIAVSTRERAELFRKGVSRLKTKDTAFNRSYPAARLNMKTTKDMTTGKFKVKFHINGYANFDRLKAEDFI